MTLYSVHVFLMKIGWHCIPYTFYTESRKAVHIFATGPPLACCGTLLNHSHMRWCSMRVLGTSRKLCVTTTGFARQSALPWWPTALTHLFRTTRCKINFSFRVRPGPPLPPTQCWETGSKTKPSHSQFVSTLILGEGGRRRLTKNWS